MFKKPTFSTITADLQAKVKQLRELAIESEGKANDIEVRIDMLREQRATYRVDAAEASVVADNLDKLLGA